jgi:hypothetical protein
LARLPWCAWDVVSAGLVEPSPLFIKGLKNKFQIDKECCATNHQSSNHYLKSDQKLSNKKTPGGCPPEVQNFINQMKTAN